MNRFKELIKKQLEKSPLIFNKKVSNASFFRGAKVEEQKIDTIDKLVKALDKAKGNDSLARFILKALINDDNQ